MPSSYKRVFILGSGFSKSFCSDMPTIEDLTKSLFDKKNTTPIHDDYEDLFQYINNFNEISKLDIHNIGTIENLTTTIFSRRIFDSYNDEIHFNKLKYKLLRYIYNSFKEFEIDKDNLLPAIDFIKLCSLQWDQGEFYYNLIITFNYDLLIEKLIKINHLTNIDYGFKINRYTQFSADEVIHETKPFQIIKLHGSFNWFHAKSTNTMDINSIYQVDPWDENMVIHENDNPIFVPMSHGKELFLFGSLYNTLWTKASNYLFDSKEIYFIGYGFPETDINNLLYFWQFKDKIKNIVVFYKDDKDPNLKRLINLFGENIVINVDAKKFLDDNFYKFTFFKWGKMKDANPSY